MGRGTQACIHGLDAMHPLERAFDDAEESDGASRPQLAQHACDRVSMHHLLSVARVNDAANRDLASRRRQTA
eukprot:6180655-Pleurochrysis_carterae.AAC.2